MDDSTATFLVVYVILAIPVIIGLWKVFEKADQPGWAAIVPVYNAYVWLKIVGRPTWWMVFLLVGLIPIAGPIVLLVISIILSHDLSKSFGKGAGSTVLLVLLPFIGFPMLGFGDARYAGPSAPGGNVNVGSGA